MENESVVNIPEHMWRVVESIVRRDMLTIDNQFQREGMEQHGVRTSLRLRDGTVKEEVWINWDGCITDERYEEWGIRAEKYGPPRFTSEDIESWGYYERVRQPTWRNPFKKIKVWKVRVWSDGRLGE